jgi:hypothetical protein
MYCILVLTVFTLLINHYLFVQLQTVPIYKRLRAHLEHRKFVGKMEGKKNEVRAHSKIPPKFIWKSFDQRSPT